MIEDLTKEKLIEYSFDLETINKLEEREKYNHLKHTNEGIFYASNVEKKIYTGIDALRKYHLGNESQISFPENCFPLMREYYDISFRKYLKQYSEMKTHNYSDVDKKQSEQYFIKNEITAVTNKIIEYENSLTKNESQFKITHLRGITLIINKLHNNITEIHRYLEWLKNKSDDLNNANEEIKQPQKTTHKPKNLFEIWQGTQEQYGRIIEKLKKHYEPLGMSFVTEKDGKLYWNPRTKGWVQYLVAFIWKCNQGGLILNNGQYSAPQYRTILINTFNLPTFSFKAFQSVTVQEPSDKYLKALAVIPSRHFYRIT